MTEKKTLSRPLALALIGLGLLAALAVPWLMGRSLPPSQTRVIDLTAKRYAYSPARIIVNRGDEVVLKATSADVTHGFLLDGYGIEAVIRQQGLIHQKFSWKDDDGSVKFDWDKVDQIEFQADRAGKFAFRCTQTCGNLHPFMTGELIVRPNNPYHLFVSLSVWLVLSLVLLFFTGFGTSRGRPRRIDLLAAWPWLKWLLKRREFQFLVIAPNLIIFYLFLISSLWGSPVGNRNVAIIFVWIFWWFVLKAVLVPFGGRAWCLMCPLPAPAEWLSRKTITAVRCVEKPIRGLKHRFLGLQKDWPKVLRNVWLQNALFLALISWGIILITRPLATAVLFGAIIAATLVLALFYRRRVFCLYLCPVGGFLSTYSMAATTELRVIDPEVCRNHKEKSCLAGSAEGWACPWGQYPGLMDRNNHCGLCTECLKSCPKDNISLFLRPFGGDRLLKGYDEVFNVIIMLVVALAFSVTMLGPWGWIKEAANVTESRRLIPYLTYLAVIMILALAVFPGLYALAVKAANRLAGRAFRHRDLMLRLTYVLIPVGIFVWIAFSLPQLMINYSYILNVLSDPLGLGWDLLGTANYPYSPFYPEYIPLIQGTLLLAGLYLGLTRGLASLDGLTGDPGVRARLMIPPALFALAVTNLFLKLYLG